MNRALLLFLLTLGLGALFFASPAQAARMHAITEDPSAPTSTVVIYIDTEGQSINAIEGVLRFAPAEIRGIEDGSSVVSLWLLSPSVSGGEAELSGLIPGGFNETSGELLRILAGFAGDLVFDASGLALYLNDGRGTRAELNNPQFGVLRGPIRSVGEPDRDPPDRFVPEIASDPAVFEGDHFLVFQTTDKGSGMDHYEVMEVPVRPFGRVEGWFIAESPYRLRDQSLSSDIYVRAVDRKGNFIIVTLRTPRAGLPWTDIILAAVLVCLIIIRRLSKK